MRVYREFLPLELVVLPCAAADEGLRQAVKKHVYRIQASGQGTYRGENPAQQLAEEFDMHSTKL